MTPPSGEQHTIEAGGYAAVVTEAGATLRALSYAGRPLLAGFEESATASGGRGQTLVPWPNRIRDGRWTWQGKELQLPVSEVPKRNASHGLVRWAAWSVVARDAASVSLGYRLMAQPGYPWTLDLVAAYAVDADGLTVRVRATNQGATPAPYAYGAHPYLTAGSATVEDDVLTLPGATRLLVDDERSLPTGTEDVAGTAYDLRAGRRIEGLVLDHAFTDVERGSDGHARVALRAPDGTGTELWADETVRWIQAFVPDPPVPGARASVAVEPMTAPPDAFNSGTDLVVLEPGAAYEVTWGIRDLSD